MIRYALVCRKGHAFESWFENSTAYDKQAKRGLVSCPICDDIKVEKAIMSPKISSGGKRGEAVPPLPSPEAPNAVAPNTAMPEAAPSADAPKSPVALVSPQEREFRQKLKELREHLTRNADYVGQHRERVKLDSLLVHFLGILRRGLAVNRAVVQLAVMHLARHLGKLLAYIIGVPGEMVAQFLELLTELAFLRRHEGNRGLGRVSGNA